MGGLVAHPVDQLRAGEVIAGYDPLDIARLVATSGDAYESAAQTSTTLPVELTVVSVAGSITTRPE